MPQVPLLIKDRPRDTRMPAAALSWLPIPDPEGRMHTCEVDPTAQRGTGAAAEYLVKWRGAPADRATWEPADHLINCHALRPSWGAPQKLQERRLAASAGAILASARGYYRISDTEGDLR